MMYYKATILDGAYGGLPPFYVSGYEYNGHAYFSLDESITLPTMEGLEAISEDTYRSALEELSKQVIHENKQRVQKVISRQQEEVSEKEYLWQLITELQVEVTLLKGEN